jgi:hypothetical protein
MGEETMMPRVFVMDGYACHGGTYMAYQIGRVCHERFNTKVTIVGDPPSKDTYFTYEPKFPVVSVNEFLRMELNKEDLFICNPSYSHHLFGIKVRCQKLMYVQHINTFEVLDAFFDHYVSVSSFVQDFLSRYYDISSPVISAFINTDLFQRALPWEQRLGDVLVVNHKKISIPLLERLSYLTNARKLSFAINVQVVSNVPQFQLGEIMGKFRHYLTLTPSEGFGLISLEAMAAGCAVFGFDGMGGRDYFNVSNSNVVPYADFDGLIDRLELIGTNPDKVRQSAEQARMDAQKFSRQQFDDKWSAYLSSNVFR